MSIEYSKPGDQVSGASILARLVDTIKVRYQIATEGLTDSNKTYRATPESMSMLELQKHILLLLKWVSVSVEAPKEKKHKAENFEDFKSDIIAYCDILRDHLLTLNDDQLSKLTIYLKREDTHYPIWFIVNGPLSDAIHHIGQMVSWRRIDGNPVPKISPFSSKSY